MRPVLADDRRRYALRHWYDVALVVLPVLRALGLLRQVSPDHEQAHDGRESQPRPEYNDDENWRLLAGSARGARPRMVAEAKPDDEE
ncbi:hypothetical protein [Nocardioides astragali]|uniref:Uncharacterized protein n=1 Tax=Nocardioides astragali TaxID=1776736 RepID=A0ABW2N5E2_9ACTN|nr:hypothetical protein [Nocardioides astragali]